jgi:hypothetical protein
MYTGMRREKRTLGNSNIKWSRRRGETYKETKIEQYMIRREPRVCYHGN